MNEQTSQRFTVFCEDSYAPNHHSCAGFSLPQLIEWQADHPQHGTPIAWATGHPDWSWRDLRDASIAVGRVIKLIDGKYVPFGPDAPEYCDAQGEPIAPTFYCAAETIKGESTGNRLVTIAELCADINRNVGAVEPYRPRLTWADSKPFDAFDGFKVKRDTATPDHAYSHPLTRVADAGAQVGPTHGSVWLLVR